ncbi:MAG: alpha-E domain-containing protein [Pseudomonadota bacterium]
MALLSRTGESLYWIGRYVERAENMARLLDTGRRMSAVPNDADDETSEWQSVLAGAGARYAFDQSHKDVTKQNVVDFIAFSQANPSSIVSCIAQARANARAIRTALTIDMWEALNEFWLELRAKAPMRVGAGELGYFLDWVKKSCALFRGVADSSQLRDDTHNFLRLGTFVERADCTARLLDVKCYVFDDRDEPVSGSVDTFQWTVVLRATSSLRAYKWAYGGGYDRANIVEFLTLNPYTPRSLAFCVERISEHLNRLARLYAARHDSHEICASIAAELNASDVEAIFEGGLHEFLTRFIARNNWLSTQIARDYNFLSAAETAGVDIAAESAAKPKSRTQEQTRVKQPLTAHQENKSAVAS